MAAYGALVSLWNDLELIPNHPTHSFSFETKQIASLSQIVDSLIQFMDTNASHGEAALVLESRMASAAHAAHDVIESHVVDQIHAGTTLDGKTRSCFFPDLQKGIDAMELVEREAMQFKEKSGLKVELPTYSTRASSSEPPTSEKNVMVGFDATAVRLMGMLTGNPSSERIILPIVGMGGIGKTTLAKNAFEKLRIAYHFDVCRWATISQEYSAESILAELFYRNRTPTSTAGNVNGLGEKLHKMLWCRRYLIVLDDMWSVEAWNEIHRFLPDNNNGSCVVVTTRISNLAAHLSSSPFKMDFLEDNQSWELFCRSAFAEGDCPVELQECGRKIVGRCRGLPLSIVVIGGHLKRSSRAIEYWEMVATCMNPISGLGEDEQQCLKIISLSYENLPPCLKPCFLYLGIYHEDQSIDAYKLLRLWVAEGFIRHNTLSLETEAEDYLKNLIDRNLILVRTKRWNGKVEFCVIHDIVREFCLKVGKQEKFIGHELATTKAIGERRIVVPRELSLLQRHDVGSFQLPSTLRSLICQGAWFLGVASIDLRLLRLSTYNVYSDKISSKNGIYFLTAKFNQVNLRYLTFFIHSGALHYSIPSSISLFWNMQTLIIENSGIDNVVPYEIWEMTQLRHLEFVGGCLLPDPLSGAISDHPNQQECNVLRNLHTLLGVTNLRLTEEVCRRMPNIKKLSLDFPNDCKASSYYCLHNLGYLSQLESLHCNHDGDYSKWRGIFLSFILPNSLEELSLSNCHWEDLTKIIKSLPRLGSLELQCVRGPRWDLSNDEFHGLKVLDIFGCDDLLYWNANSSHFPVLENLHIRGARELKEIPFDIGEIPTLRSIHLNNCSVSAVVSALKIVSEQESLGNEDIILKVHFDEMEQVERFQTIVKEECLTTNRLHLS